MAHSRCLSHQPYWIGQSSIASTALRPSAISAICGQHGLTSASRAMAIRSAWPFCRMDSAKAGSTISPTAIDMMPASRRTCSA